MPTRTNQNLTVRAGETRSILITIYDEDGAELDVAGDALIYRIARHGRMTAPHYLVELTDASDQITVSDNGSGTFSRVQYDPAIGDLVVPGKHVHELRITKTGNDARVVMVGYLTILNSITD